MTAKLEEKFKLWIKICNFVDGHFMASQKINFDFLVYFLKLTDTTSETQMCNVISPYDFWRSRYLRDYLRSVPLRLS